MIWRASLLILLLGGGSGLAEEEETLPEFAACMADEMARFEQVLDTYALSEAQAAGHPHIDIGGVEFCGTVGIVICDRSDNTQGCQRALAVTQDILRAHVLHHLPEPGDEEPELFAERLYHVTHALAHDASAGPDCTGYVPQLETWCLAREANGRLRSAVMAWQVARNLGLSEPAAQAGWIDEPSLTRPRARVGGRD